MGKQEKFVRRRRKIGYVEKAILGTILSAGFLSVAVLAPNAVQALRQLGLLKSKKRNPVYSVNAAINRLKNRGLICFANNNGTKVVRLTELGEKVLREIDTRGYKLKKPKRWDKKWRMIIFDVKEERRSTRDKLRQTLVQIGFVRLQNSVWVYPYECEDLIKLLKADFRIGKDVLYIIADSIENDKHIRERFDL